MPYSFLFLILHYAHKHRNLSIYIIIFKIWKFRHYVNFTSASSKTYIWNIFWNQILCEQIYNYCIYNSIPLFVLLSFIWTKWCSTTVQQQKLKEDKYHHRHQLGSETRQYHIQHSCQWWHCHNNSGKKEVIVKKTHHNFTFLVWIYIFFASILLCSAFTIFFFGRSGWVHVSLRTQGAYPHTQQHKSRTY